MMHLSTSVSSTAYAKVSPNFVKSYFVRLIYLSCLLFMCSTGGGPHQGHRLSAVWRLVRDEERPLEPRASPPAALRGGVLRIQGLSHRPPEPAHGYRRVQAQSQCSGAGQPHGTTGPHDHALPPEAVVLAEPLLLFLFLPPL